MTCPRCGAAMNHHADKQVEPRNAFEAQRADPATGKLTIEIHGCPGCGNVAEREP